MTLNFIEVWFKNISLSIKQLFNYIQCDFDFNKQQSKQKMLYFLNNNVSGVYPFKIRLLSGYTHS